MLLHYIIQSYSTFECDKSRGAGRSLRLTAITSRSHSDPRPGSAKIPNSLSLEMSSYYTQTQILDLLSSQIVLKETHKNELLNHIVIFWLFVIKNNRSILIGKPFKINKQIRKPLYRPMSQRTRYYYA